MFALKGRQNEADQRGLSSLFCCPYRARSTTLRRIPPEEPNPVARRTRIQGNLQTMYLVEQVFMRIGEPWLLFILLPCDQLLELLGRSLPLPDRRRVPKPCRRAAGQRARQLRYRLILFSSSFAHLPNSSRLQHNLDPVPLYGKRKNLDFRNLEILLLAAHQRNEKFF